MLLSVKPCCTDANCAGDAAIAKTQNKPGTEKTCTGCSPFFACGSCAGFVISKPVSYAVLSFGDVILKHAAVYQHPFIEDVTLSIWQPPQIG